MKRLVIWDIVSYQVNTELQGPQRANGNEKDQVGRDILPPLPQARRHDVVLTGTATLATVFRLGEEYPAASNNLSKMKL